MKLRISCCCRALAALVFALSAHAWAQSAPTPQTISTDPQDWPMYNHDSLGTRWNQGETTLSTANVSHLHEKWRYLTTGDVYATPAVFDNDVYFGVVRPFRNGQIYVGTGTQFAIGIYTPQSLVALGL